MRGKGFTLVELLVTISILAILMTISLISYGNVQRGARDARRKSDISNIQSTLEQYHADQGYYPLPGVACSDYGKLVGGCRLTNPGATKTYIAKVPEEVQSGHAAYGYSTFPSSPPCNNVDPSTNCTNYCLYATVENTSSIVLACGSGQIYAVTAP